MKVKVLALTLLSTIASINLAHASQRSKFKRMVAYEDQVEVIKTENENIMRMVADPKLALKAYEPITARLKINPGRLNDGVEALLGTLANGAKDITQVHEKLNELVTIVPGRSYAEAFSDKFEAYDQKIEELDNKIENLGGLLTNNLKAYAVLEEINKESVAKISNMEDAIEEKNDIIRDLDEKKDDLQSKLLGVESEKNDLKNTINGNITEIDKLKSLNNKATVEYNEIFDAHEALTKDFDSLKEQFDITESNNKFLSSILLNTLNHVLKTDTTNFKDVLAIVKSAADNGDNYNITAQDLFTLLNTNTPAKVKEVKPAKTGEGNQGEPAKTGGDNQGEPAKTGEGNQGEPAKTGGDNQGEPAKTGEGNQGGHKKLSIDKDEVKANLITKTLEESISKLKKSLDELNITDKNLVSDYKMKTDAISECTQKITEAYVNYKKHILYVLEEAQKVNLTDVINTLETEFASQADLNQKTLLQDRIGRLNKALEAINIKGIADRISQYNELDKNLITASTQAEKDKIQSNIDAALNDLLQLASFCGALNNDVLDKFNKIKGSNDIIVANELIIVKLNKEIAEIESKINSTRKDLANFGKKLGREEGKLSDHLNNQVNPPSNQGNVGQQQQ